jgi:gamma-glutamyltranspeptidase
VGLAGSADAFRHEELQEVLQPAIDYADQGFPITKKIASGWQMKNALPLQGCCMQMDPDSVKTFYVNGKRRQREQSSVIPISRKRSG